MRWFASKRIRRRRHVRIAHDERPRYFVKVPGHFFVQNFLGILLCALYLRGFSQAL